MFLFYTSDPLIVAAVHVLRVELAAVRERSTPRRLRLKEGLGEGETRPPRCTVVVLPAGITLTVVGVSLGTAVSDRLDLEKALVGEDGNAVGLLVQLPLDLVTDVPLGQGCGLCG